MRISSLILAAGLAAGAHAQSANPGRVVSARHAGVLYVNLATGERILTRTSNGETKVALPEYLTAGAARTTSLFDYWMSLDPNPCWGDQREVGHVVLLDQTLPNGVRGKEAGNEDDWTDHFTSTPVNEPVAMFDFGDLPFDSKIAGLVLTVSSTATDAIDSDGDGVPDTGIDAVAVFYDALSERNRTSIAPPTAAVRIGPIPAGPVQDDEEPYTTDGLASYFEVILDFGGEWFELGDSDGLDLGPLWLPGADAGRDVTATDEFRDGLADFQYLQYYAKHDTNHKVEYDTSTFVGIAAPEGIVEVVTFTGVTTIFTTTEHGGMFTLSITTTLDNTVLIPHPLPQAHSAYEGFGIAALGTGGDITEIDWSFGGCCFWYGGLGCTGFLDQIDPDPEFNPTWYNFTPFAQGAIGLLSDSPPNSCLVLDYAEDGLLDNADIRAFVDAFMGNFNVTETSRAGEPDQTADLNADGVIDNADISTFVQTFLACTG